MNELGLGSRVLQPRRQLTADGSHIALGPRALEILTVLAEANGEIVTKDELLETVWPKSIVEENALQAQISALRKALGPDARRLITVRGVGYRLQVDGAPSDGIRRAAQPSTHQITGQSPITAFMSRIDALWLYPRGAARLIARP